MKTVILCGGQGTRLKEKTEKIPKPLVDIGDKPILWHLMKFYAAQGHKNFVLCLGYKKEKIIDYFTNHPEAGWNIEFVDTGEHATKAQRLLKVRQYLTEDNFFLAYGDDVSDVPINEVLDYHVTNGSVVTLTAINPTCQFGILQLAEDGRVEAFKEKPKLNQWINGGFFVANKKIFDYIKDDYDLETETFEDLVKVGGIRAYKHDGFWQCMNTLKDSIELNKLWNTGHAPWKNWE